MEKARIFFGGDESSSNHVLECFALKQSVFVSIDMNFGKDDEGKYAYISMDRMTAIRFAKEIRRQIGLMEGQL